MRKQMPSVSYGALAGILQTGAKLLQFMDASSSGQPFSQQGSGKNQRQMPTTLQAESGWASKKGARRQRGSEHTIYGYFVPTESREEGQQLISLLKEAGIGGTPSKQMIKAS